jgi:hypothetical protein
LEQKCHFSRYFFEGRGEPVYLRGRVRCPGSVSGCQIFALLGDSSKVSGGSRAQMQSARVRDLRASSQVMLHASDLACIYAAVQ